MYNQDEELAQQILGRRQKPQGLFDRVKQNVTNPSGDNAYKAGMALFGGKSEEDGASRLANQMALMQFKDSLQDPAEKALKQDYLMARTENARRGPFWASGQGRAYYDARTGQAQAQGQQAATETDIMNDVKNKLGSGGVEGITPGTTVQAGPYNIPLNPKLTDTEQGAVSGADKFEPLVGRVKELVASGLLSSGKNREYTQYLAEGGGSPFRRMMTEDNTPLEELSSDRQELIKLAFTEGGKTLSPTELPIVKAGLDFFGKGDAQIISDFEKAMAILRSKKQLALGGRNAALQGQAQAQTVGGYDPDKEARYQSWKQSQAAVSSSRG